MKIKVYEGNDVDEYLTDLYNSNTWDGEGKVFGTDEMFDSNDFFHYELMDDGTIRKNYYKVGNTPLDELDYDKPDWTEATELTWKAL